MELVNAIELNGAMCFIGKKPSEAVLTALIQYDNRFEAAEVLDESKAYEIRRALTIRSANACNYRLA